MNSNKLFFNLKFRQSSDLDLDLDAGFVLMT